MNKQKEKLYKKLLRHKANEKLKYEYMAFVMPQCFTCSRFNINNGSCEGARLKGSCFGYLDIYETHLKESDFASTKPDFTYIENMSLKRINRIVPYLEKIYKGRVSRGYDNDYTDKIKRNLDKYYEIREKKSFP